MHAEHVQRLAAPAAQAPPLPDGIPRVPAVLTDHFAARAYDCARLEARMIVAQTLAQEFRVVARRHEADFLRLGFIGRRELELARVRAYFGLGQLADGEVQMRNDFARYT